MNLRLLALLAAVIPVVAAADKTPATTEPLKLTYSHPAQDWQSQALPIGNGRLGAMVFGDAEHEHFQLNEISLWTGGEKNTGAYQNLADLFVDLSHGPAVDARYRRELDISRAAQTVTYTAAGVKYTREYFASHPHEVLVFRLTADKPGAYSGIIRLVDAHKAMSSAKANVITASGTLDNGLAYETDVLVLNSGGKLSTRDDGALVLDNADSLTILVDAGTNYIPDRSKGWRGEHPHARIARELERAAQTPFAEMRAAHVADYTRLFNRVSLDFGRASADLRARTTDQRLIEFSKGAPDPELVALFFQYGRYLLISSSRNSLPANLQGLWNQSNNPPWRSDYHSNINVQMNYWPAEVTNLSECHLAFLRYVESLRGVRTEATRDYYLNHVDPNKVERKAVRGWTVQTENNIFGAGSFKWNPPGSAWYAQHFWEHYAFTQDKEYLRTLAYPVMKEVCEFWEDHLVALPDGTLVSPDGWSPEHGPEEKGVTYDQEIVWDLFTNYIEASGILGVDAEYRKKIIAMREKLLKPKIGRWGQLQEWMEDRDDPKDDHRHTSHLFALHPGRQISPLTTPDLANAARISLAARGDKSTGWAMAWRIAFWARLLDGDHAYTLLRNLLHITGPVNKEDYGKAGGVYGNLFDTHPPFQIDGNFGATAAIAEMLLQSHAGEIQLLPALPTAWPEGAVRGLKARGNITVDIAWSGGKLSSATLRSAFAQTPTVRYGATAVTMPIKAGSAVMVDGNLRRK